MTYRGQIVYSIGVVGGVCVVVGTVWQTRKHAILTRDEKFLIGTNTYIHTYRCMGMGEGKGESGWVGW